MQRRHPKAGQPVTIKQGPLKGRTFHVIDYLTTQYQGKDIKRIKADHLTTAMVNRGYPLNDDTVFGKWHPSMEHACVHDDELKLAVVNGVVEKEEKKGVVSIDKNKSKKKVKKNVLPNTTDSGPKDAS